MLLKISGEGFSKEGGTGIEAGALDAVARQCNEVVQSGVQLAVVVGGGTVGGGTVGGGTVVVGAGAAVVGGGWVVGTGGGSVVVAPAVGLPLQSMPSRWYSAITESIFGGRPST